MENRPWIDSQSMGDNFMAWNLMLPGILLGIVGIVMLLCLIPMCIGLK